MLRILTFLNCARFLVNRERTRSLSRANVRVQGIRSLVYHGAFANVWELFPYRSSRVTIGYRDTFLFTLGVRVYHEFFQAIRTSLQIVVRRDYSKFELAYSKTLKRYVV